MISLQNAPSDKLASVVQQEVRTWIAALQGTGQQGLNEIVNDLVELNIALNSGQRNPYTLQAIIRRLESRVTMALKTAAGAGHSDTLRKIDRSIKHESLSLI
jgi:hypothetical protein